MANIQFTDGTGAATLTNGKPAPANRFSSWTPRSRPVGAAANRESDGALTRFRLRDDFGASFELRMIPSRLAGGIAMVDIADRLVYHLLNGGQCTVNTEDDANRSYTCGLAPGAEPQLDMSDPQNLEYTLSLELINLAGSPTKMICHYAGGS